MIRIKELQKCSGCLACTHVCTAGAISLVKRGGFIYPAFDNKKCIDCHKCEETCPYCTGVPASRAETAYIAYTDESVRASSSAGGVFAILALRTLARGGVVFGASYSEDGGCRHIAVEDVTDLPALIGRKYVESDTGDSYVKCKELLLAGREVLYTGTPCQIAGLKGYLGAPYPALLCAEVGCGGVAADAVWRSYLRSVDGPTGIELVNRIGDENRAGIRFTYGDGAERVVARKDTAIHRAITLGLGIRPSCEECELGRRKSCADLTLRRYNPALDDDGLNIRRQPMTLVIARTAEGASALEESTSMLNIRKITRDEAYRHMARTDRVKTRADNSRAFIAALDKRDFDSALEKYSGTGLVRGILRAVKHLFVK